MGINNIEDLNTNPSVAADEPTAPPTPSNTQAGTPATPIDNVAQEQDAAETPEDSATGDESSDE